jgi:hypothetical protein
MKEAPNTYHVIDIPLKDGSVIKLSVVDYVSHPHMRWKLNGMQIRRGEVTKLFLNERKPKE